MGNVIKPTVGEFFLTFVGVCGLDVAKVSLFKH